MVSSPKPIAPTVNATPPSHIRPTSQGKGSSSVVPAPAASDDDGDDDDDRDGGIELADFGDFDYDAVKADDGAELWLVRAPSTVRPRRRLLFRSRSRSRSYPPPPSFFSSNIYLL